MFTLPKTELLVHPLCLGANVFGWSADEAQSFAVLDAYVAAGGNFIDTADVYSEWKEGNTGGESEAILGKWMKARNNRNKIVLATKVAKLSTRRGLSPANITAALDDSLRRLQTDYVDIYYSHEDDLKVPTEDTLGKYTELISAGKIRYIAASQHTGARLQHALDTAKTNNLASYIALQDHYNLMTRNPFELEQQAVVAQNGLSVLPFYGLAKGFLTGKYRPGITVESVRAEAAKEYMTPTGWATIDALDAIAKNHGASMSAVALAWLRSNPTVSAPIASARTVEQLLEILQIIKLSTEELDKLRHVSQI
jgi:aryl-alcohol dehydrogenase-like predicted oxidoreductase